MAASKKLTNEIIDQRLLNGGRTIKRVGNYINSNSKIEFLCLICKIPWNTKPTNLLRTRSKG